LVQYNYSRYLDLVLRQPELLVLLVLQVLVLLPLHRLLLHL
jgi:hypothetical protein